MKKNIILGIIWIFFIVGSISHIFFGEKWNQNCYTNLEKSISWNSMKPAFQNGEKIFVKIWYYNCHSLSRWDIVAYDFANTWEIYMKILYGLPGDEIFFEQNKMFINNQELKNSAENIYYFTDAEIKLMNIYIEDGRLKKWAYFIFGDNIWHSNDSRKFWAIWKKNIVWKIEQKK